MNKHPAIDGWVLPFIVENVKRRIVEGHRFAGMQFIFYLHNSYLVSEFKIHIQ